MFCLLSGRLLRRAHAALAMSAFSAFCACLFPALASAAAACEGSAPPTLTLSIVSGALRGSESERLRVSVHEDGCVAVQRPWYLRKSGQYEIRLDAAERESLRAEIAIEALRGVSADSLRQEAKAAEALAKREDGEPEIEFHALDADVFALQWREDDVPRELVWADVLDAADRQPKSAGINALASTVRAIQPLLQRDGKRVDSGSVQ
ncbi:hypothetical protein [Aquimonas sp.]|jgi:hypothetical protein|uniref:hypothetical protein n=1 Tax=Aquimonas sp. TaxID=1872588 RepID=UPI0037BE9D3F